MPDYIGNIAVPEITPSGTFPIVPDYPYGRAQLRNFSESKYGPGGAFTDNAPNDGGIGTTPYVCRQRAAVLGNGR
jgi:hypothetical protein